MYDVFFSDHQCHDYYEVSRLGLDMGLDVYFGVNTLECNVIQSCMIRSLCGYNENRHVL